MPQWFYSCRITFLSSGQTVSRPPWWWFWAHTMTSKWKWRRPFDAITTARHGAQMICPHNCAKHVKAQLMKGIWGCSESTLTSQEILPSSLLIWWSFNADKSTVSSHTPTISQHLLCCFPPSLGSLLMIQFTVENNFNGNQSWYLIICVLKSQENLEQ